MKFDELKTAEAVHNWIRGNDKVPGAWTNIDGERVTLYGSALWSGSVPSGTEIEIPGMSKKAVVHDGGMILFGNDGNAVSIQVFDIHIYHISLHGRHNQFHSSERSP